MRALAAAVALLTFVASTTVPEGVHHRADVLRPLDAKGYTGMVASHKGHVLVVDFWATWCSPCREEMPGVVALAHTYAKEGVQLTTVSADDSGEIHEAERFLDSVHAPTPRYIKRSKDDGAFIEAVDTAWTGALPALFVYDRTGRKVRALFGETPADTLAAVLRAAMAVR